MFAYDPTKNFQLSSSPQSIGIEGSVTTPTATYALPWLQNQKNWLAAGMGQIDTGTLASIAKIAGGAALILLVWSLGEKTSQKVRQRKTRKVYRKALKRTLSETD